MANPIGDLVIGLSMDSTQFSNTIKGINKQVKTAESAMKANLAVVGQAGDDYKTLEAKVSGLSNVIGVNQKKIDLLREKYKQVSDTFGESSEKAIALATQINNAVQRQKGWENQLKSSQVQMANYNSKVGDLKEELDKVSKATQENAAEAKESGKTYSSQKAILDGYTKQLSISERIIEEQKNELHSLTEAYGANSKKVREAKQQLILFQQKTQGLKSNLEEVQKSLKGVNDKTGAAMDRVSLLSKRFKALGEQADEASDKISNNLTPVLAAAGAIGLGSLTAGASDSLGKLENATNLTGKSLEDTKQAAKNLWKDGFGSDLEEATNAVIQVRNNMKGLSEEDIEQATKNAMNLANTFEADVNEVTRAGNSLMQNYGLTSKEAFDMMATGAKNGMNFSNEMFDNMSEYTINFKEAGFTANEMFSILQNGAAKGYNLDRLNDSLLEFKLQAEDSGKAYMDAMEQMSPATQKMFKDYSNGKASVSDLYKTVLPDLEKLKKTMSSKDLNTVGKGLFGTKWEDQGQEVILAMNTTNKAFNNTKGVMKEMNQVTEETFGQKFRSTINTLKEALLPLGYAILNIVTLALPPLTAAIGFLTSKMNGMSDTTQKVIGVVSILALALTPAILVLTHMVRAFSIIAPVITRVFMALTRLRGGMSLLTPIMAGLSSPIGIAVLAITALGAVFTLLWQKSKPFRDMVKEVGGLIASTLKPAITSLVNSVKSQLASLKQTWDQHGGGIMKGINAGINFIKPLVINTIKLILKIITSVLESIKHVINGALNIIGGIVKVFSGLFTGNFKKMWSGVKQMFSGAIEMIIGLISLSFVGKGLKLIKSLASTIKSVISSMWKTVTSLFSSAIKGIINFFQSLFKSSKNIVSNISSTIKNIFSKMFNFVKNAVNSFKNGFVNTFESMKSKTVSLIEKIVTKFKEMPGKMADALRRGKDGIIKGAKSIANGIISGLSTGVNGAGSGINWILDKVSAPKKFRIPKWNPPKYKHGTDNHAGGLAVVGDGNKHELIQTPDGGLSMSPNRSTLLNLPKGSSVLNGFDTQKLMSSGLLPMYKNGIGDKLKDMAVGALDGAKSLGSKAVSGVKKGATKVKDVALDVWDYVENPSKLLKIAVEKFMNVGSGNGVLTGVLTGFASSIPEAAKSFIGKMFGEGEGGPEPAGSGAKRWKGQVIKALGKNGLPTSAAYVNAWLRQIQSESGGNPKAVQNGYVDINTITGNLATGLLQTIRPTFDAYKHKGHGNILNGYDNMLAAMAYAKSRYGSNMLGVIGHGHGYANGGLVTQHQVAQIAEGNNPEMIIPLQNAKRGRAMQLLAKTEKILGVDKTSGKVSNESISNNEMLRRQDEQIGLMQKQLALLTALVSKDNNVYLDGKEIYNSTTSYKNKADKLTNIARGI